MIQDIHIHPSQYAQLTKAPAANQPKYVSRKETGIIMMNPAPAKPYQVLLRVRL